MTTREKIIEELDAIMGRLMMLERTEPRAGYGNALESISKTIIILQNIGRQ